MRKAWQLGETALKRLMKTAREKQLNIGLDPDTKRDLARIALYNSRTQRKQAALYVTRAVARDIKRIRP